MSWPSVELGDICSPKQHPTISSAELTADGYPAFGANGRIGFYKTFTHDRITVAITCRGATCGTVNVVPAYSYISGNAMALDNLDDRRVDFQFLAYALRLRGLADVISGSAQPQITRGPLLGIRIPLPPLSEQRRIAAILVQVDELRQKRRQVSDKLSRLSESTFESLFGDPVSNPHGWNDGIVLGDVANIASGVTKGRPLKGRSSRLVPYLAVVNVQDKSLWLDSVKTIEATDDEIERYRLRRNDLLLTEGGDPDKLGRGTLWNDELPDCIHQNHIFRVRLTSDRVQAIYLNWLIGSRRGKQYFLRSAKQTTGIASINMTQLRQFPLLVPPLPLQTKFADHLTAAQQLLGASRSSELKLDALFTSLQHRAFNGELTSRRAERELEMVG